MHELERLLFKPLGMKGVDRRVLGGGGGGGGGGASAPPPPPLFEQ